MMIMRYKNNRFSNNDIPKGENKLKRTYND